MMEGWREMACVQAPPSGELETAVSHIYQK